MITLRYGNTNTFFLRGDKGGLLVDTDMAGTLPSFYRAIKAGGVSMEEITYVLATHYHPDHMGLIGELMEHGIKLLLMEPQRNHVHDSDEIFQRDRRLEFVPIQENDAEIITCGESREFLKGLGIHGEILSTPSHSPDGVSLILDDGSCFVGDLEPMEYLDAYEDNEQLTLDWLRILEHDPKTVYFAHWPPRTIHCT